MQVNATNSTPTMWAKTMNYLRTPLGQTTLPNMPRILGQNSGQSVARLLDNASYNLLFRHAQMPQAGRLMSRLPAPLTRGILQTQSFIAGKTAQGLSAIKAVPRGLPLVGTAISAALEFPDVWNSFGKGPEGGRGVNQLIESGTSVAGAAAGATVGAAAAGVGLALLASNPVGWVVGAVGLAGAAIGGALGYNVGDAVGSFAGDLLAGAGVGKTKAEVQEEKAIIEAQAAHAQQAAIYDQMLMQQLMQMEMPGGYPGGYPGDEFPYLTGSGYGGGYPGDELAYLTGGGYPGGYNNNDPLLGYNPQLPEVNNPFETTSV